MTLQMTIKQIDNGWILSYTGHDCLQKETIHKNYPSVLKELDEYFGWYNIDGKQTKLPK